MNTRYPPQSGRRGTAAQEHAWTSFGSPSRLWGTLTEDQYQAWDEAAKEHNRRRHLRPGHRLNGQNLFTLINSHQAFLHLPPFLDPPEYPAFGLDPLGPLVAGKGRHGFTLKLGVPKAPAGYVLVFGARPCSPGKRYCDKLSYLGLLPAPSGGWSEISRLYYEKHGVPPPGSRVIIETQQQVNGWRGLPMRFDLVLPRGPSPAARPKRRPTAAGA